MDNKCAVCGLQMKFIPAGVSKKTGRPYNGFWACPEGHKQPPRPESFPPAKEDEEFNGWQKSQEPPPSENKVDPSVWDKKDLRIAREAALHAASRVCAAAITAGNTVDDKTVIAMARSFVEYIYET